MALAGLIRGTPNDTVQPTMSGHGNRGRGKKSRRAAQRTTASMQIRYLRFNLFRALLEPFSQKTRVKRMQSYVALMGAKENASVLDLGGQPMIWDGVGSPVNLTILNRPGIAAVDYPSHHRITYVTGDACDVCDFDAKSFETVFSNSVIEHVGPAGKRAAFAREVRRLGKSYWVQTPSKWFPIEAHCGMPFWWFYPERVRRYFIERWRAKLPAWTEMVEETTVLSAAELRRLFPEATILVERYLGAPKSYVAYYRGDAVKPARSTSAPTAAVDRGAADLISG